MSINWRAGLRRLYAVCVVLYVPFATWVCLATEAPAEVRLVAVVLPTVGYGVLELLLWAVSGFAAGTLNLDDRSETTELDGRTRRFHAFDVVLAERYHLVDKDGEPPWVLCRGPRWLARGDAP